MNNTKPVVVHYNDKFYLKIQPFIYDYISNLENFHPLYFAREFVNLDLFPLPKSDRHLVTEQDPGRYTFKWLYYGILRKYFGYSWPAEQLILRRRKVRLIHAHFGPEGFDALRWRGDLKIPVITSFYGYDVSSLAKQDKWHKRYDTLFKEGALFLVEGAFMKSRLMALGAPEDKVKIQRIAVNLDNFPYVKREPKRNGEKPIFFFCGRFVEKKGLIYSLQALKQVWDGGGRFEFRIVGSGKLQPEIETFIRVNNMSDCIKLLGERGHRDYINEMKKADIYIHPSITAADGDMEGGAPTTILEAQALGLPVLSSYHADIPNIVVPGKSALLTQEKDWRGLADNISFLIKNQDEWAKMGLTGREFVAQYHDIKREAAKLEEKYLSLIK
jgi:colanic acid/amylovoran biosynthesis glycosyltransferase